MTQPTDVKLPDPLTFQSGQPVKTAQDWGRRRAELLDLILQVEYGPMPAPAPVEAEVLHKHRIERLENIRHSTYRLSIGGYAGVRFALELFYPPGDGPFPVLINGDICWRYVSDDILMDILHRGNVLAIFDRTEVMADDAKPDPASGLYRLHPGAEFSALAGWAWSYHRCIDFLSTLPDIDAGRVAIAGHSRGGKTTLLAAATDERIALTDVNNSGCGGGSCYRIQGPKSETLGLLARNRPYWFSPKYRDFIDKETSLPFDQHSVAAMANARALLFCEAMGDLPANPTGTWHTFAGARKVFQFLGVENKIGIVYREGPHEHNRQDFAALLDFMDVHFHGKPPARRFDANPYGY